MSYPNLDLEIRYLKCFSLIIGVDEAGRGPLAGPLTIAGVSVDKNLISKNSALLKLGINDSKKLTPRKRQEIIEQTRRSTTFFSIIHTPNTYIDKFGISAAFQHSCGRMIEKLSAVKGKILILTDFFKIKNLPDRIKNIAVKKGDQKSILIALSSIYAKVQRDLLMQNLHRRYPAYNWRKNKGYGTAEHLHAIQKYGLSKYHRRTFAQKYRLVHKNQIENQQTA